MSVFSKKSDPSRIARPLSIRSDWPAISLGLHVRLDRLRIPEISLLEPGTAPQHAEANHLWRLVSQGSGVGYKYGLLS